MSEVAKVDETLLRDVVDRRLISEVVNRYCTFLDSDDVGRVAEVFTEDGIDEHLGPPSPSVQHGRAEIKEFFVRNRGVVASNFHVVSNLTLEVDGDTARGSWYITAWHWLAATGDRGPARPSDVMGLGRVQAEFRRTSDGWLIAHQAIDFRGIGVGGFPSSVEHSFE